ncbi:MAG: DUF72 domain-containing protein [Lentisphaerae bacterium]|nr:DUF72 domain-containing protein [Lentisphaerota bacterium]
MPPTPSMHFGIAGWSYPDWDGYVYPPGTKDKLDYIAPYVDAIEINSTFYRPPSARTARSWAARTAGLPDFFFTAKLHQDVTHGGRIEPAMVKAFREGLAPLRAADKLKHLLAQFRWDFADTPETRAHLAAVRDDFGGIANLTLELRHNSWQSPDALDFLRGLDVTVANLDYPMARNSFSLRLCDVGAHAYLRLHGRNYDAWFDRAAGRDETYNYLYSARELDEIVKRAVALAAKSQSLILVANNHYQGKEVANALQLKALATGRKVGVPPLLMEKYPALEAINAG